MCFKNLGTSPFTEGLISSLFARERYFFRQVLLAPYFSGKEPVGLLQESVLVHGFNRPWGELANFRLGALESLLSRSVARMKGQVTHLRNVHVDFTQFSCKRCRAGVGEKTH